MADSDDSNSNDCLLIQEAQAIPEIEVFSDSMVTQDGSIPASIPQGTIEWLLLQKGLTSNDESIKPAPPLPDISDLSDVSDNIGIYPPPAVA